MRSDALLVELLTEELPPKALKRLAEAFAGALASGLRARGLVGEHSVVTTYATPRRLAVSISEVRDEAEARALVEKLLPAKQIESSGGARSPILAKRLARLGRENMAAGYPDVRSGQDHLYVESDGKADYVWLRSVAKGASLEAGLGAALEEAIAALPVPKLMSYQRPDGSTVRFVRPAHRLVALHGDGVVEVSALGLTAGRVSAGHRFLSRPDISIASASAYEPTLKAEGKVVPGFDERRASIASQLVAVAHATVAGSTVIMPDALLDEVTALVEWPRVYPGGFDEAFLEVPQECLVLTMQQNQKYFALASRDGALLNRFLVVSNIETDDPSAIVRGNERVLRARLADAKFFFDQDRKETLASRLPRLAAVVYHNKLGSQLERVARLRELARALAQSLEIDVAPADRAAELCKADLVTDMVVEFPELQGLMGRYYALHDGETQAVAAAIEEHYWPRFAGDRLPVSALATAVALADKLESLAGLFGIGERPTGDKDPFGMRRAALGVVRILIEKKVPIALGDLLAAAFGAFAAKPSVRNASAELAAFLHDRLRSYLRDLGFGVNEVEAVLSLGPSRIDLVPARMAAVRAFAALPDAQSLAAANKRVGNILRKSDGEAASTVDAGLLMPGAELGLHEAVERLLPLVRDHVHSGRYTEALIALASARESVDRFFDDVMVMDENRVLRANRLALLRGLAEAMNQVADISKLAA